MDQIVTCATKYIGVKINRLTIVSDLGTEKRRRVCSAICECGVTRKYALSSIICGKTKSCGCLRVESNKTGHNTIHGLHKHPLFSVWVGIKKRCYNKYCNQYKDYGGRGVAMCEEWKNNFDNFYNWCIENGWKIGLELDKDKLSPNKTGNLYSPELCCFLTRKENLMHKSNSVLLEYNGEVKSLPEWCSVLLLNIDLIRNRLRNGKSVSYAFNTPVNIKKRNHVHRIHPVISL